MCAETSPTLSQYRIQDIAETAYYIPNFLTETQQQDLIHAIYSAPKPKWTSLSNRRLQNWGGYPHPKGMVTEPMPSWLSDQIISVTTTGLFGDKTPNHVLINEYTPGQGIMPHLDGPLYHPVVVNISLSAPVLMDFYDTVSEEIANLADRYKYSFLLEPKSLLCLQNEMYENTLHGIENRLIDRCENVKNIHLSTPLELVREKRVSLTIRHVEKILKVKLKLFK
eukprot:TRINITY_DN735_c8_g1_i1.p1 TRINITY_DN735_c8_g1~~TRINITY_DN735_c8_g1_i1.p1  ORF type:complete len:224 (+),score=35.80 TRINITY_DN735_c8_g1_i1:301-972(+)